MHAETPRKASLQVLLGLLIAVVTSACSPGYVLRAAYEQSKILAARRDIDKVITDPETAPEQREKLQLVKDARSYAQQMGLSPGGSFKSYAPVSRDPLAWVVVASRRDAFALHTWWFPIVGRVPYKGFFDKEDAEAQAKELEADGYECSIRGTEAFSTLGWFDDPVVSTTLKNSPFRIANTVIHESVHSTVWIPGHVAFNESLANFIGSQGSVAFFASRLGECRQASTSCESQAQQLTAIRKDDEFQYELSELVERVYADLDALYKRTDLSSEQKVQLRNGVFAEATEPFRRGHPTVRILKEVNNSEVIQLKLYLTKLSLFRELFGRCSGNWGAFIQAIRDIKEKVGRDPKKDPFDLLQEMVGETK